MNPPVQGILRMLEESSVSGCSVETQGRLHCFQAEIQELYNTHNTGYTKRCLGDIFRMYGLQFTLRKCNPLVWTTCTPNYDWATIFEDN